MFEEQIIHMIHDKLISKSGGSAVSRRLKSLCTFWQIYSNKYSLGVKKEKQKQSWQKFCF